MPPLFEYVCQNKKCSNVFTELAKFEDKIACPKCNKSSQKQIATTYHPVFLLNKTRFRKRRRL